jgi:hypothetical protein
MGAGPGNRRDERLLPSERELVGVCCARCGLIAQDRAPIVRWGLKGLRRTAGP